MDFFLLYSGFHNSWNTRVGVRHPSLWIFIRHMKDAQSELEVALDALATGDGLRDSRRKWRMHEAKLKRLKRDYARGTRSLNEYWQAVRNCITCFI
jgi:hypothetical protein